MQVYLVRRVILALPTLLLASFITFAVVNLLPGSVVEARLADAPQRSSADSDALRHQLGLDRPVHERYIIWVGDLVRGDLGKSLWSDRSVRTEIWDRFPVTAELALLAFIIASVVGITLGVVSATRRNSGIDHLLRFIAILGLAVPNFWIATMVVVFGSKYFGYLPSLERIGFTEDPLGNLQQFGIPAAIIGFAVSASIMRMVRASMLEVLRQDYIRTAYSKGLRERAVIYRHSLKNAMLPVATIMGLLMANLLAGTVIIESIFNLSGVGRLMLQAIQQRDFTMIQGVVMTVGAIMIALNIIIDVSYTALDPRIKLNR